MSEEPPEIPPENDIHSGEDNADGEINHGRIDNPDWTDEQNRRFDTLDQAGFTTEEARRHTLAGDSSTGSEVDSPVETALPPERIGGVKPKACSPAQSPGVRRSPAYDKIPHRDDESELPEQTDESLQIATDAARKIVEGFESRHKEDILRRNDLLGPKQETPDDKPEQ